MRFGVLFAVQLALAASEPTVLLQTQGDWQEESLDVEGAEESRQWQGLWHYANALMNEENMAPAFLNLLKTATKKRADGAEYLELKPLVTMVMDVGRMFVKQGEEAMLPRIHQAYQTTAKQSEEMVLATEKLITDIFLTKGEATEIMDYSLAIRARETAEALQRMLVNFMPMFNTVIYGADAVMNVGQFAAGSFNAGPRALVALTTGKTTVARLSHAVKQASEQFEEKVDEIARSTIKNGAQYSEANGLKMKSKAIKHILKKVTQYETYLGELQDKIKADWMNVIQAFDEVLPASVLTDEFKTVYKNLIIAVDDSMQALVLGATGRFKKELQARSHTMK